MPPCCAANWYDLAWSKSLSSSASQNSSNNDCAVCSLGTWIFAKEEILWPLQKRLEAPRRRRCRECSAKARERPAWTARAQESTSPAHRRRKCLVWSTAGRRWPRPSAELVRCRAERPASSVYNRWPIDITRPLRVKRFSPSPYTNMCYSPPDLNGRVLPTRRSRDSYG